LSYADTVEKNTEFLADAKEVGINIETIAYMLLPCHQNGGEIHNIEIANISFENVAQFKYF
jgi:hypothetical protein